MKLFECVPNFSDGQRPEVIRAIVAAAESVQGAVVLDLESDASHNRSVLTFVGEGDTVVEAAFRATQKAAELIDLNHHKGEHPRMGAMDVVPFIPLGEATREEAVALAKRFGARVARELKVPVYYYGFAATRPDRVDLPKVREGQFEGIREKIATDPTRKPDEGEAQVHPTAGAIAVGARPVLVAYNIYLTTPDVSVAKRVAKAIRASNGGLAEVRALGFEIKEKDRVRAQVSMNMTDVTRTPLHRAFEMVQSEAARYGVVIEESEIVGLVPEDTMLDAAEHYLRLNRFDRHLLLERRVQERTGGSDGADRERPFASGSISAFVTQLAARTATPGGGSAAAVAGAMGCGLVEMVLRYTAPAGQLDPTVAARLGDLAGLREALTRGIDDDSRSYEAVRTARAAKKQDHSSPAAAQAFLDSIRGAAEVPISTAETVARVEALFRELRPRVKPMFASDASTADALLAAAKQGALANAEVNLLSLQEAGADAPALRARVAQVRGGP